jgi:hypothetical protein
MILVWVIRIILLVLVFPFLALGAAWSFIRLAFEAGEELWDDVRDALSFESRGW